MAKERMEWILNKANQRWGLTKKDKVGPVAELIRRCAPRSLSQWEGFYYQKVYPKQRLIELGQRLYVKVSEVLSAEIAEITEEDCIRWIEKLVINRTYEGYLTEKQTVYEQLEPLLGVPIHPAPDKWDRSFNVDFYIELNGKYIGLQIKPETYEHAPEAYVIRSFQTESHRKFTERFGGKVFTIISVGVKGGRKEIYNSDVVVAEIRAEMQRLRVG